LLLDHADKEPLMSDQQPKEPRLPEVVPGSPAPKSPTETKAATPASNKQGDLSQLTAEEQMALYEKDLKENDWGHQPC
jgi:hypothetical protein